MNGKRTLVTLAVGLISLVCAQFGVDFGALVNDLGITPDELANSIVTKTPGWLNAVIAIGAMVLAAVFRVLAKRTVIGGKPLDPPQDGGPRGPGMSNLAIAALGCALLLSLAACVPQPLERPVTPASPKQALASAWLTHGWANKSITDLRRAELISAKTFATWAADIDRAERILNAAQAYIDQGHAGSAKSLIEEAVSVLNVLQPLIQQKLDEHEARTSFRDRVRRVLANADAAFRLAFGLPVNPTGAVQ